MPLANPPTDELVRRLAGDEEGYISACALAESDKFHRLATSPDGTWLMGEYAGLGPVPYQLSADFHVADQPVLRSNSPSRKVPDKYILGLIQKYVRNPHAFTDRQPSVDLVTRRDKVLAAEERKKGVFAKKGGRKDDEKGQLLKIDSLDAATRMIADLSANGNWYADGRADQYEKLAKQLNEAHLTGLAAQLKRFALVAKDKGLKEPEKVIAGAHNLARLAAVYRKTVALLSTDLSQPSDEDLLAEEFLDITRDIDELKRRGYGKTDLSLFELAFERLDDEGRAIRSEVSNLLDLNSGELHQAVASRPFKGLSPLLEQTSYTAPIAVADAVIYPGTLNRRVRWIKNSETPGVSMPEALEAAYGHAIPEFEPVIDEFRTLLRTPLAPREAVLLLRCAKIGSVGDALVVEDESGLRLEMRDRRKDYSHLFNFKRAASMMATESPALLARLTVSGSQIVAYPLAMLTPKQHLRLGI